MLAAAAGEHEMSQIECEIEQLKELFVMSCLKSLCKNWKGKGSILLKEATLILDYS